MNKKTQNKINRIAIIFCALLIIANTAFIDVFAAGIQIEGYEALIDDADLFSTNEEEKLAKKIKKLHDEYDFDFTIITMNKKLDTSLEYFADYYEGVDIYRTGVVFVVNMYPEDRGYMFSTRKKAMYIIDDNAFNAISKKVKSNLTDGDYYDAFNVALEITEDATKCYRAGKDYKGPTSLFNYLLAFILSLVIAFIATMIAQSAMKTNKIKSEANSFIDRNQIEFRDKKDKFINRTVVRTKIQENTGSGGGIGGSIRSGAGGSRGGGGGSF